MKRLLLGLVLALSLVSFSYAVEIEGNTSGGAVKTVRVDTSGTNSNVINVRLIFYEHTDKN